MTAKAASTNILPFFPYANSPISPYEPLFLWIESHYDYEMVEKQDRRESTRERERERAKLKICKTTTTTTTIAEQRASNVRSKREEEIGRREERGKQREERREGRDIRERRERESREERRRKSTLKYIPFRLQDDKFATLQ